MTDFGYCICCICHSKYNCLLYLQVAGQVLIITASLNKKPGAATPGFLLLVYHTDWLHCCFVVLLLYPY